MEDDRHICYVVNRGTILNWLNHSRPVDDYELLGIQLHFKGDDNGTPVIFEQILWSRVFLKKVGDPLFFREEMNGPAFNGNENFLIELPDEGSSRGRVVDALDGDNDFRKLQYYPKENSINFAFFEKSQLQAMIAFHEKIIFSGAKINLGSRLGEYEATEVFNRDEFFALKMEGLGRTINRSWISSAYLEQNTSSENTTAEPNDRGVDEIVIAKLSPVFIGPTCPPMWYIAGYLFRRLDGLYPTFLKQFIHGSNSPLRMSFNEILEPRPYNESSDKIRE